MLKSILATVCRMTCFGCKIAETNGRGGGGRGGGGGVPLFVVVDHFYIALFSALEQTPCARM